MRRASMVTLILTLMISALSGCSDDSTTAPTEQAPTLPNPAQLSVPLDFFAGGADQAKAFGHQNFYNAYLRAVIVSAMTDLVLAPPPTPASAPNARCRPTSGTWRSVP